LPVPAADLDPSLRLVVAAWSALSPGIRGEILKLAVGFAGDSPIGRLEF
jgi:hypothetical protein